MNCMLQNLISGEFAAIEANWVLWLLAGGGLAALVFGADRAVSAAVRLAAAAGMSKVIIGATVVSLGTTAPEACTSVTAAFQGNPGLALGNGVGSVICDTALIFGLCCCLARLPLNRFVLYRHGTLKLAAGALLTVTVAALAIWRGGIEGVVLYRWIGVAFLVLLVAYMAVSVRWARGHPEAIPAEAQAAGVRRPGAGGAVVCLLVLAAGLGLVVLGARLLVGSATVLCERYGVPPDVVAVTVVALGTSLPELVTAVVSVLKGHPEIAIGNVIGADILNILFVVGASATVTDLAVPATFFYLHLPVMMLSLGLMGLYIFTSGRTFKRWQGVPLLAVYAAYVAILVVKFGGGRS